ncbi:MAG: TIGR02757 family protein [Alistipes sp.]|nr:TIGR02757 family protein [Alistipes sp.]
MEQARLRELLERLHDKYNRPEFIGHDPISIPHRYTRPEDIEISGLLAATIAWGNRKAIVKSAARMMEYLDDAPYDFTVSASHAELSTLASYVHRTFNGQDLTHFILALRRFYTLYDGLGGFFQNQWKEAGDMRTVLSRFRAAFFAFDHPPRCEKHLSSIDKGAACKRINMYLRWMVRRDGRGVDFGLWKEIPASALYLPIDVHAGNMGRHLGLLTRRQTDWKAVEEITANLRTFDADDPVKYDYSLFGAGIDGYLREN